MSGAIFESAHERFFDERAHVSALTEKKSVSAITLTRSNDQHLCSYPKLKNYKIS
jgi:hypothetical protein